MVIFHSYSIVMGQFTRGYFHEITNKSPLNPIKSLNEATFSIIFHSCLYVYHINHNFSWENHHVQRENHHFFCMFTRGSSSPFLFISHWDRGPEPRRGAAACGATLGEDLGAEVPGRPTTDDMWRWYPLVMSTVGYGNSGFSHWKWWIFP